MFTRNFWMAEAANRLGKLSEVSGTSDAKPKLISVSGAVADSKHYDSYSSATMSCVGASIGNVLQTIKGIDVSNNVTDSNYSKETGSYGCIVFGSGNTPATIDDYKLSGDPIQNISYSYANNSTYNEDGSATNLSYNYTITNNNDTAITIGEIGMFTEAMWKVAYSNYIHNYYLLERTVLENPITIPAGGVGQVTYNIQINYPVG